VVDKQIKTIMRRTPTGVELCSIRLGRSYQP